MVEDTYVVNFTLTVRDVRVVATSHEEAFELVAEDLMGWATETAMSVVREEDGKEWH